MESSQSSAESKPVHITVLQHGIHNDSVRPNAYSKKIAYCLIDN